MHTQRDKAVRFQALHALPQAFLIPNAWSAGTARLLELKGFAAIASTSAGYAYFQGKPDNGIGRERTIEHLRELVSATTLPVSADLENGFGTSPDDTARTIRLAAAAGVVGGSIEDSRNDGTDGLFAYELAVERVRAAAEAAHALPFPFMLTARCENFVAGRPDLQDTIRRLQGYQEAGADVLFAPGLRTLDDIATVVKSVDRPVNVIMGFPGVKISVSALSAVGVRRISVGAALARAAFAAFLASVDELREQGTFRFAERAVSGKMLNELFAEYCARPAANSGDAGL
ncbi:MAG TPA: isocitrate lyase/phosphoenolpyruvate mutase family protein [Noviherbaspirillum sp.]|uniref:isocitrate lyase/PEP mutase family protein n=1 Tax=Noviherbaspirillum sp. TaxID=1926288 RepID=UPI002F955759